MRVARRSGRGASKLLTTCVVGITQVRLRDLPSKKYALRTVALRAALMIVTVSNNTGTWAVALDNAHY